MNRRIYFILNPKAGNGRAKKFSNVIDAMCAQKFDYKIGLFSNANEFNTLIKEATAGSYTDVIAVGGDGTVNSIASKLVNTNICLGIIPTGSGNGLARSLRLSMDLQTALEQILKGKNTKIDFGTVNNIPFFCTSGIGFDAHIGSLFASSKKRGLQSYVKITISELMKYRSKTYSLHFNGQTLTRKAYLITVANAGQYGNDFYIAPEAKLSDGKFHVVILKPFNIFSVFGIFIRILQGKANRSGHIETYVTNELTITREEKGPIHFDGEPEQQGETIFYKNVHQGLNVIVGEGLE